MKVENSEKSTQVTLKIPAAFLKDFDAITAQLGYPRNEAIREAMRRFLDFSYQKINERNPERVMGPIQGMISALFGGMNQDSQKIGIGEIKQEKKENNSKKPRKIPNGESKQ